MIARLQLWFAGLGVVLAAIGLAFLRGLRVGAAKQQVKALENEVEAHETRNEVENRVARERDVRQRLRDEWSR